MNKDKQAFVYLWMDSKNKMWYLGIHCGNKPSYTHSSSRMEKFTWKTKPSYMKRRILAYGTNEEIIQLEHNLIERYDLTGREDYYNAANVFPFPSGPSHPNYIDGKSNTKEYRQKPEVKAYRKEYRQRPEVIEHRKEYLKEYRQRPEVKEYHKEYEQRPERKKYKKEYHQRPEAKAYRKEYRQRPEVKAKKKEYLKEYRQRPEVKAKKKEYMKEYGQRPEVIERNKEYNIKYYSENKEYFQEYYQRKVALNK